MTERQNERHEWLGSIAERYNLDLSTEKPASADAGFRSYFRVADHDGKTYIVMDAPTDHEDVRPFIRVTSLFEKAKLTVPHIYEQSVEKGFLLLTDLGEKTYLNVLNEDNARELMGKAIDALVQWQSISEPGVLPEYDYAVLRREIDLFPEWYVGRHRGYTLTEKQSEIIEGVYEKIIASCLAQPKVFVHRDFMPRNLMVSDPMPGVLDFQDALYGPVTYDIASLMRDAFISWGESFVLDITIRYWDKARKAGIPVPQDFGEFWREVEWMGMQRHLKVLGIFARINYRDGRPKYLEDTPRFLHYVRETANRYNELKPINWLLDQFEEQKTKVGWTY